MDVVTLVEEARRDGVKFEVDDGDLLISAAETQKHLVKTLSQHRAEIIELLGGKSENTEPPPTPRIETYQPFPTDALPEPVRGFVEDGAKSIVCDPTFLALPMLSALAAAIGNTRKVLLKPGWPVPACIWTAIVGESGTAKTPAFRAVMRPVRKRQENFMKVHMDAVKQHEIDTAYFDKEMGAWKRDKKTNELPPENPAPPQASRLVVGDTTVEALSPILLANPRGLLMARDELAGWIASFDRYTSGKGGDAANWLSMFHGESITVDRRTGHPPTIHVPEALVSITGGIQPSILHRALGREHRESGLAARFLMAYPPRKPKQWTEADIAPAVVEKIEAVFEHLYDFTGQADEDGAVQPQAVALTPHAKEAFKEYYNAHAQEHVDLGGELSAAWAKLEEYAVRLALVIHCVQVAAGEPTLTDANSVDEVSMAAGIRLAEWFKHEARRVYSRLSETEEDQSRRELVEWITRKGGSVTARDVQQGRREFKKAPEAEEALDELVKARHGQWEPTPPGRRGQPTRRFVLSTVYGNTLNQPENSNTVDVDTSVTHGGSGEA
jgi:hypothetical protein